MIIPPAKEPCRCPTPEEGATGTLWRCPKCLQWQARKPSFFGGYWTRVEWFDFKDRRRIRKFVRARPLNKIQQGDL